jgi:hypothetical protein
MGKHAQQKAASPPPQQPRDVPADYQPSKAELEADVSIPGTTPDALLEAVINGGRRQ